MIVFTREHSRGPWPDQPVTATAVRMPLAASSDSRRRRFGRGEVIKHQRAGDSGPSRLEAPKPECDCRRRSLGSIEASRSSVPLQHRPAGSCVAASHSLAARSSDTRWPIGFSGDTSIDAQA
jgi:hypothetical protein